MRDEIQEESLDKNLVNTHRSEMLSRFDSAPRDWVPYLKTWRGRPLESSRHRPVTGLSSLRAGPLLQRPYPNHPILVSIIKSHHAKIDVDHPLTSCS